MAIVRSAQRRATGLTESVIFAHKPSGDYRYRQGLGMLPSNEYRYYFNDFNDLVSANAVIGSTTIKDTNGTLTNLATGTDNGGIVRVTGSAGQDGVVNYFPKSVVLTGKRFFIEARVRASTIADCDFYIGLSSLTATTNPEDVYTTAADSLAAFGILDGGGALPNLIYDKANAGPVTDSALASSLPGGVALANSTFYTIALFYNGAATAATSGSLIGYVNGSPVIVSTVAAKIPDNVLLAPFFGARCGDGGVSTIDFDYLRYSMDR
jgi:hypothetical protein